MQQTATPPVVTVVPPVPGADAFRTVEYNRMGALDAIRAADGYALGYTGAGVTIGLFDPAADRPDRASKFIAQLGRFASGSYQLDHLLPGHYGVAPPLT